MYMYTCILYTSTAVSCEAEIDEVWRIEWPFIPTNEVATVSCGANFIGTLAVHIVFSSYAFACAALH